MTGEQLKIPKIIFDMDGVITGEECYWDAAALVVWEMLVGEHFLGLRPAEGLPPFNPEVEAREIARIRKTIFQDDRVISLIKEKAVNSNSDLAYFVFTFHLAQLLCNKSAEEEGKVRAVLEEGLTPELKQLSEYLQLRELSGIDFAAVLGAWSEEARGPQELSRKIFDLLPESCSAAFQDNYALSSPLYNKVRTVFQEWYLGEHKYRDVYGKLPAVRGKKGLIYEEKPVLPVEIIHSSLQELCEQGWLLGIATGRPLNELFAPLEQMDLWKYFDDSSVVTFDVVEKAEIALRHELDGLSLGKPHPFPFLKAYWGDSYTARELVLSSKISRLLPEPGTCWVVGDSLADLLGAKKMEASFAGVLTGHGGVNYRRLFKEGGADVILPDISYFPAYLGK